MVEEPSLLLYVAMRREKYSQLVQDFKSNMAMSTTGPGFEPWQGPFFSSFYLFLLLSPCCSMVEEPSSVLGVTMRREKHAKLPQNESMATADLR